MPCLGPDYLEKKSKNILNLEKVCSGCFAHRHAEKNVSLFLKGVCGLVCRKDEKTMLPSVLEGPAAEQPHQLRNNDPGGPCKGLKQVTDNWWCFSSQSEKLIKTRREPDFSVKSIN